MNAFRDVIKGKTFSVGSESLPLTSNDNSIRPFSSNEIVPIFTVGPLKDDQVKQQAWYQEFLSQLEHKKVEIRVEVTTSPGWMGGLTRKECHIPIVSPQESDFSENR